MARWLSGSGIEIGALHNPLAVPPGVEVRYVDRLPESGLRDHYPELEGDRFVPVSVIGDAQDLSALSDDSVDFVIANHLFEHLENPIRGLEEMVRVIRPGGVLYLALPDPRVTFDRDRDLTSVEHVLADYQHGPQISKEAHYTEWAEKAEPHTVGRAGDVSARVSVLLEREYSIHFHVWRPDTFLDFLSAARTATGLELDMVGFAPCEDDDEFIFVFLKGIQVPPRAVPRSAASNGGSDSDMVANDGSEESRGGALREPLPEPATRIGRLKQSIAGTRVGPVLRPIYRATVRLRNRHDDERRP